MTEPSYRRSRRAWPLRTEPTTTPAGTHDHAISNTPMGMAFTGIVLLLLVNVALVAYVFIARESRDEQNRQTNQRINQSICDLLDQLPEGGLLERPRAKYGCGPGIPFDQLPPEVQDRLTNPTPAVVAPEHVPLPPAPPRPAFPTR